MVIYFCNSKEVEAGGQGVQGQLWLHNEFQASLGYMKPSLNNNQF